VVLPLYARIVLLGHNTIFYMSCKVYHGYAVLISTFILRFTGLGIYFIIGAHFVIPLSVSFGTSVGITAFFPSVYSSVALLIVVFSGYVQDQLKLRGHTVRPVFIVGSLCVGVGSLGGSYSRTFPALLVNAAIMGVGIGNSGFAASGILSPWFVKRRGTFLLMGLSGGGFGGFVYALMFEDVMLAFHEGDIACTIGATDPSACEEWRPALRWVGVVSSLLMLLASMFMRLPDEGEVEAYEGETDQEEMVKEEGTVTSDDDTEVTGSLGCDYTLINDSLQSTEDNSHKYEQIRSLLNNAKHEDQQPELSFNEVIRTRTAICIVCWSIVFAVCLDSFFVFIPYFAEYIGLSSEVGALALSLSGLALMIGNLTLGVVADRFGHTLAMQVCMVALTGACIGWPFCKEEWSLILVSCCVGYFFTCTSLFVAILSNEYEHTAKGCILTLIGFVHAVMCPGLLIGPVITGMLIDNFESFYGGAFFLASMCFISLIAVLCLPTNKK